MKQENVDSRYKRDVRRTLVKSNIKKVDVTELYEIYNRLKSVEDDEEGILLSFYKIISIRNVW